jgi:hypothetical protein
MTGTSGLLRILEDAQSDPALLALATVDLTYSALAESERTSLTRIRE